MRNTLVLAALVFTPALSAQFGPPPGPPKPPKAIAPIDLTGYWVSIVTEDWRFRMIAAPKGDFAGVPLNPAGQKIAKDWDPAKDEAAGNQCKAYGAAGLMRLPTRLHITWTDENTLKIETDAGTQTRIFHFGPSQTPTGAPTLQGYSAAQWLGPGGATPLFDPSKGGSLEVNTSHLAPGYLRRNGVPYSDKTTVTEYYDVIKEPEADWLIVKTIVNDPQYLIGRFITSTHFRKQPDAAGWKPSACYDR
ncbi:MAG: hypothetical protein JOZ32_21235 [Bryobacterales bacterium]|nr:hypothetical protein [Bryobacterales bacterium]